ncbi:MAG: YqgE/AlgH family protein [Saprospiraceae bacterium]|jgi:putative transcriptional regulator|nr:YqgE/AlgH family protein [Saprospiraceae bacterium]
MVREEVKNGSLLIAEPFMLDPNFKRAAVLLCEHSAEGSIGFILNKPLGMRIDELIEDFPEFDSEVFFGGPVQTDTIHYIHSVGDLLEESVKLTDGVYWGGDFEKLKFLISSQLILPQDIRFFLGYSGWSEGQLADEIVYGSWVLAEMYANYVFKSRPDQLWQQAMFNKGNAYTVIARMPENYSAN